MTCTFEKEKLTAYYDGELDAGEKAQVEGHISACSECLRELGEIKSASVLVKTLSRPRAPQAIAEGVAREIAATGRRGRFDQARRAALWVTAAAAGLFVVANVLWFSAPERSPEARHAEEPALAAGKGFLEDEHNGAPERASARAPEPEAAKRRQEGGEAPPRPAADALAKKDAGAEKQQAPAGLKAMEQRETLLGAADKAKTERDGATARKAADEKAGSAPAPTAKAEPSTAKPAAPAAPPPAAAAAPAPEGADRQDARAKAGVPPSAYVCESAGAPLLAARTAVEEFSSRRRLAERKAVASGGAGRPQTRSFGDAKAPPPPLTLDLTDAEIAELSKELEKQGLKLVPASPEQEKQLNALPAPGAVAGQGARGGQEELRKAVLKENAEPAETPAPAETLQRRANTRRITIYFTEKQSK